MLTHIFIFFLGPGFPRGFGMASAANCEAVRFIPGFGPGMPLRFIGLAGGTRRLLFGVDAAALGDVAVTRSDDAHGAEARAGRSCAGDRASPTGERCARGIAPALLLEEFSRAQDD